MRLFLVHGKDRTIDSEDCGKDQVAYRLSADDFGDAERIANERWPNVKVWMIREMKDERRN